MGARAMWLTGLAVLFWCGAAQSIQQTKSLYTAVDPDACDVVSGSWPEARLCEGLPGYPIYVVEGPQTFLSVGENAAQRRAAQQTLQSRNSVLDRAKRRATIEWRFIVKDEKPVPYATIIRYFTRDKQQAGEVLVVMRVSAADTCHVAYIDALANPNAMVMARRIADKVARSQPCPTSPAVQGARGRSPM